MMRSVCILTDSAVQFPQPSFPGRNLVRIIPIVANPLEGKVERHKSPKVSDFPIHHNSSEGAPKLQFPNEAGLEDWILSPETRQPYDDVLAIFSSSQLLPICSLMQGVAKKWIGQCNIQVIDSQTTSIGLGVIVQSAAEGFAQGASFGEVEQVVRGQIPHIYTILCTPNYSYLHQSRILDAAQAQVGEMMGFVPVFVLEEGMLSPLEKVKNQRQVIDLFQEFMDEFDHLQQIALLLGSSSHASVGRLLREHASTISPKVPFTEHNINPTLATLLGPQASGITVVEAV